MLSNISKFSWAELFSNDNGKTSGTAFVGIIICLVGTLCFLLGCIDKMWVSKDIDIITQSIVFVGIGATLMGVRKVVGQKSNDPTQKTETTTEQPVEQINS
jgi:uncharacterized membrane protein